MARKPVAITGPDKEGRYLVVCDDGAVFESHQHAGTWGAWNPIPGTEADSDS